MPIHAPHVHFHFPHWKAKPLSAAYLSFAIRSFALSIVGIFIPLYILNVFGDFMFVLYYFGILSAFAVLLAIPLGWVVTKIGLRRATFLGSIFLAVQLFLLIEAQVGFSFVFLASVFSAVKLLLFWLPYHTIFVKDGSSDHYGREVSVSGVLAGLTAAAGPLVGGLLIMVYGFSAIFYTAIVLVLMSSIPLFFMPHHPHYSQPPWKEILSELFDRSFGRTFLAFWGARSVNLVAAVVWPVFLLEVVKGSYESVGVITSAVLLISVSILVLVGVVVDKFGKRRVLKYGAFINGVIWISKAFIQTPFQAFTTDSLQKLFAGLQGIPFMALTYVKARGKRSFFGFLIQREIALHLGGVLTLAAIGVLWKLEVPLSAMFTIAALGSILSTLMISAK